jgi:quercetin dioxygenase-like cupin family protein
MTETRAVIDRPDESRGQVIDDPKTWIGRAWIDRMSREMGTEQLQVYMLNFEQGARGRPHIHPYDQLLYYVRGTGVVAVGGGEDQLVEEGSFVLLPANVVHMHGAADAGPASHISMMWKTETSFDCEVPDSWRHWLTD